MPTPAFQLGQLVTTPAALKACNLQTIARLLAKHQAGDCGGMSGEDVLANIEAIKNGGRVFSSYSVGLQKIWIITEADRSSTCVMLPGDY